MKTLSRPCIQQDIAFFDDPEALGCLLHEVIYLTTKTRHGEVCIDEIDESARQLGYRGSSVSVRKLLLSCGFVSEVEQGNTFRIQEENREIIEHFFDTHQSLFERKGLTVLEKISLFEHVGLGGSQVEIALTQIMRSISFMLELLRSLPDLESNARASLALHEVEHFIAFDRVKWCNERMEFYSHTTEVVSATQGGDSDAFRNEFARYMSMYLHLADLIEHAEEQNDRFKSSIRDIEIIELLKMLRIFLTKFTVMFVQKEIEGV